MGGPNIKQRHEPRRGVYCQKVLPSMRKGHDGEKEYMSFVLLSADHYTYCCSSRGALKQQLSVCENEKPHGTLPKHPVSNFIRFVIPYSVMYIQTAPVRYCTRKTDTNRWRTFIYFAVVRPFAIHTHTHTLIVPPPIPTMWDNDDGETRTPLHGK